MFKIFAEDIEQTQILSMRPFTSSKDLDESAGYSFVLTEIMFYL